MADFRRYLPGPLARLPADLIAVLVILLITDLSLLAPLIRQLPFQIVTGFIVLLFLPGYVLTTVLFPEGGGPHVETTDESSRRGIDGIERVVLSIAFSLILVMATVLGLDVSGIGITLTTTLVTLNVIIVILTAGATIRRHRVPPEHQFQPALGDWVQGLHTGISDFDRVDRLLSMLFIGLILFAVAGTLYTAAVPGDDEQYTEFYLLSEGPNGELGATEYPTEFTVDESRELVVSVENHEFESVEYTVVVELQNVTRRSPNATIRSEQELHRFQAQIAADESWQKRHAITVENPGTNLRLQYLLYRGEVPSDPTRENAYDHLHLWINSSN